MLYRPAFAVLEYGGDAWQKALEWEIEQAERRRGRRLTGSAPKRPRSFKARTENAIARRSRLVVVDVGSNAGELRRRYPDRSRFLVMRAYVGLVYVPKSREPGGEGPRLAGTISNILPETVYLPREVACSGRRVLDEAAARRVAGPAAQARSALPGDAGLREGAGAARRQGPGGAVGRLRGSAPKDRQAGPVVRMAQSPDWPAATSVARRSASAADPRCRRAARPPRPFDGGTRPPATSCLAHRPPRS